MRFASICSLSAIACLVSSAGLLAQENVSLKLDVVSVGENIEGLSVGPAGGAPVSALAFRYSKPLNYAGSNILEISQKPGSQPGPAPTAEALAAIPPELLKRRKENPNLVALALLPAKSKRVTVLLSAAVGGTYQATVIDDDPSKLPYGKLRIHNYSPLPVALNCNRKPTGELKPKSSVVVAPVDKKIFYELAYQIDGKWKVQGNNLVEVEDDEQVQFVVLKSDASFFASSDGTKAGYLQSAILRRNLKEEAATQGTNE